MTARSITTGQPINGTPQESISPDIFRELVHFHDLDKEGFRFSIARQATDYFAALKLVQDVYIQEGYVNKEESACPCRILENHFYEKTAVFIGKKAEEIVFTVSLFPDTTGGLPMDRIYGKELDKLRASGRKIGEVGCLATHPDVRDGSQNVLMHGNKIMLTYAMKHLNLDDLVITIHPKHLPVYQATLMFEKLGQGRIKSYSKVNNNPAVALRLDLHQVEARTQDFFGNNPDETNLHHFMFIKESASIHLPSPQELVCHNFDCFFDTLTQEANVNQREFQPLYDT